MRTNCAYCIYASDQRLDLPMSIPSSSQNNRKMAPPTHIIRMALFGSIGHISFGQKTVSNLPSPTEPLATTSESRPKPTESRTWRKKLVLLPATSSPAKTPLRKSAPVTRRLFRSAVQPISTPNKVTKTSFRVFIAQTSVFDLQIWVYGATDSCTSSLASPKASSTIC